MSKHSMLKVLPGVVLLMSTLGVTRLDAQSVCVGPFLGQVSSPEVCVNISETIPGGATLNMRGPSGLNIMTVVGAYAVDLTFTFASDGAGSAMVINGTVTRMTAGTGGLVVRADGGLGEPLSEASGSLSLIGMTTGTSQTLLGGGAGYLVGQTGDLQFVSLGNTICQEDNFAAGAIDCVMAELSILTDNPLVAVSNVTSFNINDVGETITIPSASIAGDPPLIGETDEEVLELPVDGVIEHFPKSQFRLSPGDGGCPPPHWHLTGMAQSLEGTSIVDPDPPGCGLGEESDVLVSQLGEVTEDMELPYGLSVDSMQVLAVDSVATLTIPEPLTLTVASGAALVNAGTINNTGNTIRNFGGINAGTINNTGTITNECGGIVNNTGMITGNPIIEIPCSLYFPSSGMVGALRPKRCSPTRRPRRRPRARLTSLMTMALLCPWESALRSKLPAFGPLCPWEPQAVFPSLFHRGVQPPSPPTAGEPWQSARQW